MRSQFPALVLNADYTPLSYVPLSVWSWQDTMKAVFRDVATVLASYDKEVSSPSVKMQLPSVRRTASNETRGARQVPRAHMDGGAMPSSSARGDWSAFDD